MARLMEQTATLPPILNSTIPKFQNPESLLFRGVPAARPASGDPRSKRPSHQANFQAGAAPPSPSTPNTPHFPSFGSGDVDPKLYPVVARVAAYYQHRCEAIVGFQQQRCLAWANMQRQRYIDMMQGSKLVVAWYIRDRIKRRRRRERRKFNSGLRERASQTRGVRQDAIQQWVAQASDMSVPPDQLTAGSLQDKDEADFTIDSCKPLDQESKMLQTVDNLIKSQTKKVELPVLGVLDLSESDCDSEEASLYSDEDDDAMDFDDTTGEDIYDSDEGDEKKPVNSAEVTRE